MSPLRSRSASFRYLTGLHKSALSALLLLGVATTALAGTFLAFGPKNYIRGTGDPVKITDTFSVLNPNTQYTLKAFNGGLQNDTTEYVSETIVTLNGVTVISSNNFNQNVAEVDVPITLQSTNTLSVVVRGKPGGALTVEVVGVDNDPPTIKATPSPLPNAAGWNNSTVTVTFTCNDATSGVASCPAPQTVTTEGSKAISGTATDNAGNTASTSITVNIDETPPTITASASPAANSNGWNNSNVTVTFSCADSLSGVAACPSPVTTSTEAANQLLSGTATDVAGNTASASATINLDKTPPAISITSPVNSVTLTSSSVSVTGNASDSLSGVSTVTCNGVSATVQTGSFTCSVNLSLGSNTITAQATDLAGNPSSANVNVTRSNPPLLTSLTPTSAPVGTSVTVTGSYFGATQGTSTVAFNGVLASPSSWSDTQIMVPVPSGTSSGNVIVTASGLTSSALPFTVLTAPIINSLSPTSGPVGTSVIISGVNFGATQGSSTVTFNGVSATPTSWSDTQIVVAVPSGAITGPVLVTVAGQISNGGSGPTFAVGTPPTIIAAFSPAPNANGWINFNVTATFTCTAGSAAIATCPPPQTITSEGANQPVSGTATDTDGTTATTTIYLNIDKTKPVLAITSPADGSTASSSTQTVVGSATDSLSGLTSITCNGTNAPLSSGTFSCNISLNVGVNLIVVRATDLAGNVAGSNFHVSLPGTLPPPQSLTVTPFTANFVVGQTQQLTAVDELGRPRPEATWTVSDPTIATISGDPTLTVIAPGPFTLTATAQGVSTQTLWNAASGPSLPPGTVQWSAPIPPAGSVVQQIVQAVPTSGGPDLYSVETNINSDAPFQTTVRAYMSDGRSLWTTTIAGGNHFSTNQVAVPDGNGGVIFTITATPDNITLPVGHLVDLDAQTGAQLWEHDGVSPFFATTPTTAVGPDGTIYFAGPSALDGATGAPIPGFGDSISLGGTSSIVINNDSCNGGASTVESIPNFSSNPSVGSDGAIYYLLAYGSDVYSGANRLCSITPASTTIHEFLVRIAPAGSSTATPIASSSVTFPPPASLTPNGATFTVNGVVYEDIGGFIENDLCNLSLPVIPDGQGGAFVPRCIDQSQPGAPAQVIHVTTSGNTAIALPQLNPGISPFFLEDPLEMVLGENNVAFATDGVNLVSFDFTTGQTLWSYQAPSLQHTIHISAAISGGGLVINDSVSGLISFDSKGAAAASPIQGGPDVKPWALGEWTGFPSNSAAMFAGPSTSLAVSEWPVEDGAPQAQRRPPTPQIAHFIPFGKDVIGIDPTTAINEIKADLPQPSVAIHFPFVTSGATVQAFLDTVKKPLSAIGFIGHSLDDVNAQNQVYSVGLGFFDKSLAAAPNNDPQFPVHQYANTVTTPQIQTEAKVVFIGSCFIGPPFLSLWNIQSGTTGKALIVPQGSSQVLLGHALTAWAHLLDDLILKQQKVQDAVSETNQFLRGLPGVTEQWQIVGDGNVKIY